MYSSISLCLCGLKVRVVCRHASSLLVSKEANFMSKEPQLTTVSFRDSTAQQQVCVLQTSFTQNKRGQALPQKQQQHRHSAILPRICSVEKSDLPEACKGCEKACRLVTSKLHSVWTRVSLVLMSMQGACRCRWLKMSALRLHF